MGRRARWRAAMMSLAGAAGPARMSERHQSTAESYCPGWRHDVAEASGPVCGSPGLREEAKNKRLRAYESTNQHHAITAS
eukprot:6182971-Pleurochrysis_carterae.AAC.3